MSKRYPKEEYNIREVKGNNFYKIMIVNTALTGYVYKKDFSWSLILDIDIKDVTGPYKMPTEPEAIILNLFEDTLAEIIKANCSSQYVGRITTNGHRELYFHIDTPKAVHEALQKFMNTDLNSHEFSYDIIKDEDWNTTEFFYTNI